VLVRDGGSRCARHPYERRHGSEGKRKTGRHGVNDRERIKRRDKGLCQECLRQGHVTLGDEVDHIIPLSAGGSDADSNKELLCRDCHKIKSRVERRGSG
jgi:5-methylcytosine-specific restriction protein A